MIDFIQKELKKVDNRGRIASINQVLKQYGLTVNNCADGPRVTRFYVALTPFVNLTKINKLQPYLAIALNDSSVRSYVEANKLIIEARTGSNEVNLCELMTNSWMLRRDGVKLILGKSVEGQPLYADLAKCKHILVAGTTGSGKSILLHSWITSMLLHNPLDVQIDMIDMKGTEFAKYKDLPTCDTFDSVDDAIYVVNCLVAEMQRRYKTLQAAGCRDIESYREKGGTMSRMVLIIDEFADLILTAKKSIQEPIIRLAQKARACGIHLIIATQRPSSNVITGLIKANMPTKVCLKVNTALESRIVIDRKGGEMLYGNGDMLFLKDGSFEPVRVQGCMVHESEIDSIINNLSADYRSIGSRFKFDRTKRKQNESMWTKITEKLKAAVWE